MVKFAKNNTGLFDIQRNSETQLMAALANKLEDEYALSVVVDTVLAINEINSI